MPAESKRAAKNGTRKATSQNRNKDSAMRANSSREPAFEMIVLGCGGGPLETDCSGYIIKPARSRWEDGVVALEGGSGIGALSSHIAQHSAEKLFPSVAFPSSHNTPILKAAYIFSHLACYLISHAHLDHAVSLVLLSGSIPPRQPLSQPEPGGKLAEQPMKDTRIPVYAMRATLENLSKAYGGGLWPELGTWASEPERGRSGRLRKRRKTDKEHDEGEGVGAMFSPLSESSNHRQLHPALPISTKVYPLLHGSTSSGQYQSSAVFLRYDPGMLASQPTSRSASRSKLSTPIDEPPEGSLVTDSVIGREFLFFGDMESEWRPDGKEDINVDGASEAGRLNKAIWAQAAQSFSEGRLAAVFIECSYDSSRPAEIMFGHVSPPAIIHELQTMASFLPNEPLPLAGLRVYITHIKAFLVPHDTGLTAHELVRKQLCDMEKQARLGVEFIIPSAGDRLLI